MPRHYRLPGHVTTYDLKVCPLPDGVATPGMEPTEALNACVNPVIDDKANPGTFYPANTGIGNSIIGALEPGKRYAAQVTIHEIDESGQEVVFANQGQSEAIWFRYGPPCDAATEVNVTGSGPGQVDVRWVETPGIAGYKVFYRPEGASKWTLQASQNAPAVLKGLAPGKYEVAVLPVCSTDLPDAHSVPFVVAGSEPVQNPFLMPVATTDTAAIRKIPCAAQVSTYEVCSPNQPIVPLPTGTQPLASLKAGDLLTMYDLSVVVTEVTQVSGDGFSGNALVRLPVLGNPGGQAPGAPAPALAVSFRSIKAWKSADGFGGCVYAGEMHSRSGMSADSLQREISQLSGVSTAGTLPLETALKKYGTSTASGSPASTAAADAAAIVKATDTWADWVRKTYPGEPKADSLLKALDNLNKKLLDGSLAGTASVEKAYKDLLDGFNHPGVATSGVVTPGVVTPGVVTLPLDGRVLTASASNGSSGYNPFATPVPGSPNLTYLGINGGQPYWQYIGNDGTRQYITRLPGGSSAAGGTYAIASQADWEACGRSPLAGCPGLWHPLQLTDSLYFAGIRVDPVRAASASISWQPVAGAVRYEVYYKTSSSGELQKTLTAAQADLSGLSVGSSYTFRLEAYDASGKLLTQYDNGAFTTLSDGIQPPKNLVQKRVGPGSIALNWDKDPAHTAYELVYTDPVTSEQKTLYPTTNSVTITGLDSTKTYPFTLVAKGTGASLTPLVSAPATGTLSSKLPDPCAQPLTVTAQVGADLKSFTLSWQPIPGQTGTRVRYYAATTALSPDWKDAGPVSGNSIQITSLITNTLYAWEVTPLCPGGNGTPVTGNLTLSGKRPPIQLKCGAKPMLLTSQTPLDPIRLQVGDEFYLGDYPCTVLSLTKDTPPYAGTAAAVVPQFGMSSFLFAFKDVTLNNKYEAFTGSMKTISNPLLRKKLTDQRNAQNAANENAQPVINQTYNQPVASVAPLKDADGKPLTDANGNPKVVVQLADGKTDTLAVKDNLRITGSDGRQVSVSRDGSLTPPNGIPVTPPEQASTDPKNVGDGSLIVTFQAAPDQHFGFDGVQNGLGVWGRDNFSLAGQTYYVPIKSIQAGQTDKVRPVVQGSGAVTYSLEMNGTATALTPDADGAIALLLPYTGNAALYAKDSQGRVVGKLTVLAYPLVRKNVVLVSLNGSQLPDVNTLEEGLNRIFAQGVAAVSLSQIDFTTNAYTGTIGADRDDHYRYSPQMKAIVNAFKADPRYQDSPDVVYLFFGKPASAGLAGVMNRGYPFGFLFDSDEKVVAHELAHGLFALEHTDYDGSTSLAENDLMDVANDGTRLYKYQWVQIQHPPSVWPAFESSEDGEFSLPILAPNGKLLRTSFQAVVCRNETRSRNYYQAENYAEGSPFGISPDKGSGDIYLWDNSRNNYALLKSWNGNVPVLGTELPGAVYQNLLADSTYWAVYYFADGTSAFRKMKGGKILKEYQPVTCTASQDAGGQALPWAIMPDQALTSTCQEYLASLTTAFVNSKTIPLYFKGLADATHSCETVTLNGREFKNITILQYGLTPGDKAYIDPALHSDYLSGSAYGFDIDGHLRILCDAADREDLRAALWPAKKPKRVMLFANGYRNWMEASNLSAENPDTDNRIFLQDNVDNGKPYWAGIDASFIARRKPEKAYYVDGHHSIVTSNHNVGNSQADSKTSFGKQLVCWLIRYESETSHASILATLTGNWRLWFSEQSAQSALDCPAYDTAPNISGFNTRMASGRLAGYNLVNQLEKDYPELLQDGAQITLDVVAHSMGFAYAQGLIDAMRSSRLSKKILWDGYYILAPENGCSGTVNPASWQEIWQYGSNLGEPNADPMWQQDGIAPQCAVKGLENTTTNKGRAFIPANPGTPKNFLDSHSIGSYLWVFQIPDNKSPGYVSPVK